MLISSIPMELALIWLFRLWLSRISPFKEGSVYFQYFLKPLIIIVPSKVTNLKGYFFKSQLFLKFLGLHSCFMKMWNEEYFHCIIFYFFFTYHIFTQLELRPWSPFLDFEVLMIHLPFIESTLIMGILKVLTTFFQEKFVLLLVPKHGQAPIFFSVLSLPISSLFKKISPVEKIYNLIWKYYT